MGPQPINGPDDVGYYNRAGSRLWYCGLVEEESCRMTVTVNLTEIEPKKVSRLPRELRGLSSCSLLEE
jgi:hypothetical protein